jgi:hypothetical protein
LPEEVPPAHASIEMAKRIRAEQGSDRTNDRRELDIPSYFFGRPAVGLESVGRKGDAQGTSTEVI